MFKIGLTSLIAFALPLCAFSRPEKEPSPEPVQQQQECCLAPSPQINIRHTEPRGVGYYDGYTTLEAFYIPLENETYFPYADIRVHAFNNGKGAVNAGFGSRYARWGRYWGGNVYYDYREAHHKKFNQLALGFETIGSLYDIYANGYIGLGSSRSYPYHPHFLDQKHLYTKQRVDYAFSGLDVAARFHLLKKTKWDLFVDAGSYYYRGYYRKNIVGGRAALGAKLYNFFFVQASTSYDRVFKWAGQGTIGLTLPLGKLDCVEDKPCDPCNPCVSPAVMRERLAQIPAHQEIIVVNRHKRIRQVPTH